MRLVSIVFLVASLTGPLAAAPLVYPAAPGPGNGKHVVFLAGDEEYRSEEGLPMLGRILSRHHGFRSTVLFSIDPASGHIHPNVQTNIPGMAEIASADLVVLLLRFRELPDSDMKYFVDHLEAGKPLVALRTSTHAFAYDRDKKSRYARYDWRSKEWPGGFGQQVLGDTWISHHGDHGKESTRGIIESVNQDHPILRGVRDVWGPTDVYGLSHLPSDVTILMRGQVLAGMAPSSPPVEGAKNTPMVPIAWTRDYRAASGKTARIFVTTMGSSTDLVNEDLRRMIVNACYWATGLEDRIPPKAEVGLVGEYRPTAFGFDKYQRGIKPSDLALP